MTAVPNKNLGNEWPVLSSLCHLGVSAVKPLHLPATAETPELVERFSPVPLPGIALAFCSDSLRAIIRLPPNAN